MFIIQGIGTTFCAFVESKIVALSYYFYGIRFHIGLGPIARRRVVREVSSLSPEVVSRCMLSSFLQLLT